MVKTAFPACPYYFRFTLELRLLDAVDQMQTQSRVPGCFLFVRTNDAFGLELRLDLPKWSSRR